MVKIGVGELRQSSELGYTGQLRWYVRHACVDCGKERWTIVRSKASREARNKICMSCARSGARSASWKGGRYYQNGYIQVWVGRDNPYYSMRRTSDANRVFEHRLVMAQSLGRCLEPWEIVHHINGKRDDNRIENLQLISERGGHLFDTIPKSIFRKMNLEINKLRIKVKYLEEQIKET